MKADEKQIFHEVTPSFIKSIQVSNNFTSLSGIKDSILLLSKEICTLPLHHATSLSFHPHPIDGSIGNIVFEYWVDDGDNLGNVNDLMPQMEKRGSGDIVCHDVSYMPHSEIQNISKLLDQVLAILENAPVEEILSLTLFEKTENDINSPCVRLIYSTHGSVKNAS